MDSTRKSRAADFTDTENLCLLKGYQIVGAPKRMETKHFRLIKMEYFIGLDRTVEELKTRWKNITTWTKVTLRKSKIFRTTSAVDTLTKLKRLTRLQDYHRNVWDGQRAQWYGNPRHVQPSFHALREKTIEEIKQGCQKAVKDEKEDWLCWPSTRRRHWPGKRSARLTRSTCIASKHVPRRKLSRTFLKTSF
jgi:hypothetical protein